LPVKTRDVKKEERDPKSDLYPLVFPIIIPQKSFPIAEDPVNAIHRMAACFDVLPNKIRPSPCLM
jgi:hypothetical protein